MKTSHHNTRLAVALVVIITILGATAGRAMHLHQRHSVHTRAIAVDGPALDSAFAFLGASALIIPILTARKLSRRVADGPFLYASVALASLLTRPPPFFS